MLAGEKRRSKFTIEQKIFIFNETRRGNSVEAIAKRLGLKSIQSIYQARKSVWYREWEIIVPRGIIRTEEMLTEEEKLNLD